VAFAGRATAYDVLDADTWPSALVRSPALAAASLRFTRKNARFFAGYAVDARHIPLAWTPPGRVFVEVDIAAATRLRGPEVVERAGDRPSVANHDAPSSRAGYRTVAAADAFAALPGWLQASLGRDGRGALALVGTAGPVVAPVRWLADDGPILASVPMAVLDDLRGGPGFGAALAIDRPSSWRARGMQGCMVQGTAELFVPAAVRTGRRALATAVERTGGDPDRDALLRLRPRRVVWWHGWTSASVRVA
jgi:hypothetical protein